MGTGSGRYVGVSLSSFVRGVQLTSVNPERPHNIGKGNNDPVDRLVEVEVNRWEANSTIACRQTRNRPWDTFVIDVVRKASCSF